MGWRLLPAIIVMMKPGVRLATMVTALVCGSNGGVHILGFICGDCHVSLRSDKGCGYQLTKVFLCRYMSLALVFFRYILSHAHKVRICICMDKGNESR